MQIDIGAPVKSAGGEDVGRVERVVLNPTTKEVDALVVHKGLMLTRDVVVPLSLVQDADRKGVRLRIGRVELKDLPDFIERHYVVAPSTHVPTYPYAPGSMLFPLAPPYGIGGVPAVYEPVEEVERIPPEDVDISDGTEVETLNGVIGVVEELRTDPLTDRVSSILVKRGILFTREVEIPVEYVSQVADDRIRLSLTTEQVEALPEPTTDRYLTVEERKTKGKAGGKKKRG